jgi:hypothetical protein
MVMTVLSRLKIVAQSVSAATSDGYMAGVIGAAPVCTNSRRAGSALRTSHFCRS